MSSATIPRHSSSSIPSSASRKRHPSRHTPMVADDYAPLELPLKWRDPPPEYPPLKLPLKWRDPPPLHCQIRVPKPPFSSIPNTAVDSNHCSSGDPRAYNCFSSPEMAVPHPASAIRELSLHGPSRQCQNSSAHGPTYSNSRRTDAYDVPKMSPLTSLSEPTPPPSLPLSPPNLTLKVHSAACVQDGLPRPDPAAASATSRDPTHLPLSTPSDPPTSPSPLAPVATTPNPPNSLSLQLAIGPDAELDAESDTEIDAAEEGLDLQWIMMNSGEPVWMELQLEICHLPALPADGNKAVRVPDSAMDGNHSDSVNYSAPPTARARSGPCCSRKTDDEREPVPCDERDSTPGDEHISTPGDERISAPKTVTPGAIAMLLSIGDRQLDLEKQQSIAAKSEPMTEKTVESLPLPMQIPG
ncbi:pollen-specific leucine-rich repeat extensin-like protein 1 [Dendrobium catenatum]|uniref:pollen-specific leucine-rich repeat extensin-like protein 1 n=1 Tax=Dendrobium catenatum TaxID=906689 RepID=UPI0010A03270|nr:pollen-specific leucine-rich repeat extensin-like protein 1 [Dendrobium catenatum]